MTMWVMVTVAPNGVVHAWGPYESVNEANRAKREMQKVEVFDRGIRYVVCKVLSTKPMIEVVERYAVSDTTTEPSSPGETETDTDCPSRL